MAVSEQENLFFPFYILIPATKGHADEVPLECEWDQYYRNAQIIRNTLFQSDYIPKFISAITVISLIIAIVIKKISCGYSNFSTEKNAVN